MLVTFKTSSYPDITMFGSAAVSLLKLMGQSGNVPGAIMPADVPAALKNLEEGLAASQAAEAPDASADAWASDNDDDKDADAAPVPLSTRAQPLVELLQSARDASDNVTWDE